MNPNQKANELLNMFRYRVLDLASAKFCASTIVDYLLEHGNVSDSDFWYEVKFEIDQIKK